ncbi:hypothetical protein [Methanofollis ethanolicus]|uniref:hypothetical protein n=1 Tax=Methanofollis ethanolicus TaxID=488124 RepID=UPI00082B9F38|nr:hypothetical protein [Methanofollis ethanolicus]
MKGRTAITVLILAMAALIGTVVAANETPVVPQEFSGTLTINGNPAPVGTVIEAFIDGTSYGKLTTDRTGVYGGVEIDDDRLVVKGGGDAIGKTITFTVNGNKAAKTAVFRSGELGNIDLSVQAGGGTTPGGPGGSPGGGGAGGAPSSPQVAITTAPALEAAATTATLPPAPAATAGVQTPGPLGTAGPVVESPGDLNTIIWTAAALSLVVIACITGFYIGRNRKE